MNKPLLHLLTFIAILFASVSPSMASKVSLEGQKAVVITDPAQTHGYNMIIVAESLNGASLVYTPDANQNAINCVRYGDDGESFATTVALSVVGNTRVVNGLTNQTSYTFTQGTASQRVRVIDYSAYMLDLSLLNVTDSGDCTQVTVRCANATEIPFYTPVASRYTLSRDIKIKYHALTAESRTPTTDDEEETATAAQASENRLISVEVERTVAAIPATGVRVPTPYEPTEFTVEGDRFVQAFAGQPIKNSCMLNDAVGVIAAVNVKDMSATSDNVKRSGLPTTGNTYGDNAPVPMEFEAEVSPGVSFSQWQVSAQPDFAEVLYTYPYTKFSETFGDPGIFYVRFYASSAEGVCTYYSDNYIVAVGESSLECPNAFSPNDDGVNDLWRVSYRSLSEFECHIYDRWGQEMYHFDDPAGGWDGTRGGKGGRKVPTGVYYYVIKAKGTDGKNYKLAGDINIISYRSK